MQSFSSTRKNICLPDWFGVMLTSFVHVGFDSVHRHQLNSATVRAPILFWTHFDFHMDSSIISFCSSQTIFNGTIFRSPSSSFRFDCITTYVCRFTMDANFCANHYCNPSECSSTWCVLYVYVYFEATFESTSPLNGNIKLLNKITVYTVHSHKQWTFYQRDCHPWCTYNAEIVGINVWC